MSKPLFSQSAGKFSDLSDAEKIICEKYLGGADREQIMLETGISPVIINTTIQKHGLKKLIDERNDKITTKILQEKVPLLNNITTLTLNALLEFVKELDDPEVRKKKIVTIADARGLSAIVKELNDVVRLELGKATQKIDVNHQMSLPEAQKVIDSIRAIDPIFDYPTIETSAEVISRTD
jgi:hypothetical protein